MIVHGKGLARPLRKSAMGTKSFRNHLWNATYGNNDESKKWDDNESTHHAYTVNKKNPECDLEVVVWPWFIWIPHALVNNNT